MLSAKLVYSSKNFLAITAIHKKLLEQLTTDFKEYFDKGWITIDSDYAAKEGEEIKVFITVSKDEKAMQEFINGFKTWQSKKDRALLRASGIKTKLFIDDKEAKM